VNADGGWQSPIVKFFSDDERGRIASATEARPGTLLFFQADHAARANAILARLRVDLGTRLGRVDGRVWDPLVVTGFPVFDRDPDSGKLDAMHMPFVAPLDEDLPLLETEPDRVRGSHYDIVVNGVELGSGSLRNHRSGVQRRILEILGYSKDEMEGRFGFLLNALDAGAPPHGGFAFGVERMVMVLSGVDNIRDVVAFPKTQRGQDLLMGSPSDVDAQQLADLGLRLRPTPGGGA
jgi:aspartyl-tRNA synthetase